MSSLCSPRPTSRRGRVCATVHVPGGRECPDLFTLPVDGDAADLKWVFWAANSNYLVGTFDGTEFHPETEVLRADHGKHFYAAQTWYGLPESQRRCVQIAWMGGGEYPQMPFDQQLSFPCELVLRRTPSGLRMDRRPVEEVATLRGTRHHWQDEEITHTENLLDGIHTDLLEIRAEIDPGDAREVIFAIRGEAVRYEPRSRRLSCGGSSARVPPGADTVRLHLLVDRTSIEVFADDGAVSMSSCFLPQEGARYRLGHLRNAMAARQEGTGCVDGGFRAQLDLLRPNRAADAAPEPRDSLPARLCRCLRANVKRPAPGCRIHPPPKCRIRRAAATLPHCRGRTRHPPRSPRAVVRAR